MVRVVTRPLLGCSNRILGHCLGVLGGYQVVARVVPRLLLGGCYGVLKGWKMNCY